ncbi:MAG: NUDIX domain-containing protein [Chitinispirillaceae bacterium]|nr:NUDIX domain-containing protein [Chitinispirillaceae bacterium]
MIDLTRFVFCPRCGVTDIEVYHQKGMRCSECGYIYYHNTAAAVGAIIEHGDGVLLTVRAHDPQKGKYELPGGFVDYSETLEEALVREIREELGIDVTDLRYFGSFPNTYTFKRVMYHTTDTFFVCRCNEPEPVVTLSEEIERYEVVAADQLPLDRLAFDSMTNILREYTRKHSSGV